MKTTEPKLVTPCDIHHRSQALTRRVHLPKLRKAIGPHTLPARHAATPSEITQAPSTSHRPTHPACEARSHAQRDHPSSINQPSAHTPCLRGTQPRPARSPKLHQPAIGPHTLTCVWLDVASAGGFNPHVRVLGMGGCDGRRCVVGGLGRGRRVGRLGWCLLRRGVVGRG